MASERLQKILSNAGVASRRVAEEMILAGRVSVNGNKVDTLGARADPDVDEVMVDGVPVLKGRYRYFALHKPAGFVTTARDELGRETVLDLVPIGDVQLHPVGRLDLDSEGLVVLTNDGHLTDLLTHPRYEVDKEYLVGLDAMPAKRDIERLVRGIEDAGERLRAVSAHPAAAPKPEAAIEFDFDDEEEGAEEDEEEVTYVEPRPEPEAWLILTLKEGKNREIRRMMAAIGREVLALRRIRIGPLLLGTLSSGSFREITPEEVDALYAAAGGKRPGER
ncbi:MAG: pseudouridine synthase [Dehalococcoidia bacterium]